MGLPARSTRTSPRGLAPRRQQASKPRVAPGPAITALSPPHPAATGRTHPVVFNVEDVVGPKSCEPTVERLMDIGGYPRSMAEEIVVALKEYTRGLRAYLLAYEPEILTRMQVTGANDKLRWKDVPGSLLAPGFELDEEGIYLTPHCMCVPFADVRFEPAVPGVETSIACKHPAPPVYGILKEIGVTVFGVRVRSTPRNAKERNKHAIKQQLEVRPHAAIPFYNSGPVLPRVRNAIEVFRGSSRKNNMSGTAAVETEEPPLVAAQEVATGAATSAQELSLPATPTSQSAIRRLGVANPGCPFIIIPGFFPIPGALEEDLFDLLEEDLPFTPAVTYTAEQGADMAANEWLEQSIDGEFELWE
jgi:hypothetical protein